MKRRHACALALSLCALPFASPAMAQAPTGVPAGQNVRFYEENGVTYQETHQTYQRQIPETQLQPQSRTVLRGQWKTDTHDIVRTVQVPITEYKYELYYRDRFNPFVQPTPAYRLVPVTRYEARSEVTRVPVSRYEATPTTETYHVPVTTYRTVPETTTHRVAVGTRPAGTSSGAVYASQGGGGGAANYAGGTSGAAGDSNVANRPDNTAISK
jgi:hypothetical protein